MEVFKKNILILGNLKHKLSQNEIVRRRIFKGQKTRPKHKILKQTRQHEHAMVGEAGGVLSAADHVVIYIYIIIYIYILYTQ